MLNISDESTDRETFDDDDDAPEREVLDDDAPEREVLDDDADEHKRESFDDGPSTDPPADFFTLFNVIVERCHALPLIEVRLLLALLKFRHNRGAVPRLDQQPPEAGVGMSWPGTRRLMQLTGVTSGARIAKAVRELRKLSLVRVVATGRARWPSVYELTLPGNVGRDSRALAPVTRESAGSRVSASKVRALAPAGSRVSASKVRALAPLTTTHRPNPRSNPQTLTQAGQGSGSFFVGSGQERQKKSPPDSPSPRKRHVLDLFHAMGVNAGTLKRAGKLPYKALCAIFAHAAQNTSASDPAAVAGRYLSKPRRFEDEIEPHLTEEDAVELVERTRLPEPEKVEADDEHEEEAEEEDDDEINEGKRSSATAESKRRMPTCEKERPGTRPA